MTAETLAADPAPAHRVPATRRRSAIKLLRRRLTGEQLELSDPVLVTLEFAADRMWTDQQRTVQVLTHLPGFLRELPTLLADDAGQRQDAAT